MANFTIPKDVDVKTMLSMLLGDGLKVTPSAPLTADDKSLVAVYINDDGKPVAAGVCDAAFAAFAVVANVNGNQAVIVSGKRRAGGNFESVTEQHAQHGFDVNVFRYGEISH